MVSSLVIDNNYSTLKTDNEEVIDTLWKLLRFKERGVFMNPLYKARKWDGFRDFFSKKTGKFLTGLLPEVKIVLKQLGIEYTIQDKRDSFSFVADKIDENFMNYGEHAIKLYDYQVEIANAVFKHKRGIIFAPPGAGKSNVMIAIIKNLPPKTPTLLLGNKKSLVDQNYAELMKWGIPNVGRLYSDANEPNYITCATVQSISKLDSLLPKIKVLVVDELHEMCSKTALDAYRKLSGAVVRVAASGTPFKHENNGGDDVQKYRAKGWFGSPFKVTASNEGKITTKFLQERNTLSKALCTFFIVKQPQIQYSIYADAITEGIVESQYLHDTVTRLVESLEGRTLILVERLAHGDTLHSLIPNSFWIKGEDKMKVRQEVIKHLKSYKGNVIGIATTGILNTGIDVKIHNLVNLGSGKASHVILQRIGRGLRTAEDKDQLNYYDFLFDINPYLKNHSEKRIKMLKKVGLEVVVKEIDF